LAGCAAIVAIVALAAACHSSSPGDAPAPAASAAALRPAAGPVDHLAVDEVLEGTDKAFDVTLPRGLRIDGAFVDVIMMSGPLAPRSLVAYFRAHVQNGDLREGEVSSTFDQVTAPGNPDRPLSVHIAKAGDGAHVEIRDLTPVPLPPMPDEAARWKHVGLTPSGRILDPTHLD
jgi:hypothetical protein